LSPLDNLSQRACNKLNQLFRHLKTEALRATFNSRRLKNPSDEKLLSEGFFNPWGHEFSEFYSEFDSVNHTTRTSRNSKKNQKRTQSREDAKNPQSFLCGTFAALRLCVKIFVFFALN